MRLGICVSPDKIALAAELGFDYIEWGLATIAGLSDAEFEAVLAKKPSFPIPIEKCNGFLPGTVHITGNEASESAWRAYVDKAFSRAHALGVKVVVFGSGAARGVPEGFSFLRAWQQIHDFLVVVTEYAEKYDINIAIEPLRRQECNIVNLVSEGLLLSAWVDHPRIGVLGDTFHMLSSAEPWSAFRNAGEHLYHVHISHELPDMSSRTYPAPNDGSDYAAIFDALKKMNYQGDVSIEAGCKDFAIDGKIALECLKPLMA